MKTSNSILIMFIRLDLLDNNAKKITNQITVYQLKIYA